MTQATGDIFGQASCTSLNLPSVGKLSVENRDCEDFANSDLRGPCNLNGSRAKMEEHWHDTSATDLDRLFREAHASSRQNEFDCWNKSFLKAMLEFHAAKAEDQLQASRMRNAELLQRSQLLEQVLHSRRSQYAMRLFGPKGVGASGVDPSPVDESGFSGEPTPSSSSVTVAKETHVVSASPAASGRQASASQPWHSAAEFPPGSWRYFGARVPRTRKRLVRAELCQALRSIGLRHVESLFEESSQPIRNHGFGADCDADGDVCSGSQRGTRSHSQRNADPRPSSAALSPLSADASKRHASQSSLPSGWKTTLQAHSDSARSVAFTSDTSAAGPLLVSCGEDSLVKVWNLSDTESDDRESWPKDSAEALTTFRGHGDAVLSLALSSAPGDGGTLVVSGDVRGQLCAWLLPSAWGTCSDDPSTPLLSSRSQIQFRKVPDAHCDAIWSLCFHPEAHGLLGSVGADGCIRLWRCASDNDFASPSPPTVALLHDVYTAAPQPQDSVDIIGLDQPTSLAWMPWSSAHIFAGFTSSSCAMFDAEACAIVHSFGGVREAESGESSNGRGAADTESIASSTASAVMSVACQSMHLIAAGYADRRVRLFCPTTGRQVMDLEGHTDAVSSICFGSAGSARGSSEYELATGCHDGVLRIFDIRTGCCSRSVSPSDHKSVAAIHSVFHGGDRVVTAGSDGNVVIFGLTERGNCAGGGGSTGGSGSRSRASSACTVRSLKSTME
eukprot:TRINITY_DN31939_c0_g1_i1.p1 TRINITY_DN31939_c0_g1~~TRINITY_DN31939_c0_g1_i1.p1  ORF type:complete len:742 (+),score=118.26 TRINITY_DN31939_c0_g1_i1:36-2228(+)